VTLQPSFVTMAILSNTSAEFCNYGGCYEQVWKEVFTAPSL